MGDDTAQGRKDVAEQVRFGPRQNYPSAITCELAGNCKTTHASVGFCLGLRLALTFSYRHVDGMKWFGTTFGAGLEASAEASVGGSIGRGPGGRSVGATCSVSTPVGGFYWDGECSMNEDRFWELDWANPTYGGGYGFGGGGGCSGSYSVDLLGRK